MAHVPGVFPEEVVARMTQVIDSVVAGLRDGSAVFGPHETMRDVEFETTTATSGWSTPTGGFPKCRRWSRNAAVRRSSPT